MAKTIDARFFPHILSEVISHCDFRTQNALRLLSSSTKNEVDRIQCRDCTAIISFPDNMHDGGPISVPIAATLYMSRGRFDFHHPFMPAMWLPDQHPIDWRVRDELESKLALELATRYPPRQVNVHFEVMLWNIIFSRYEEYAASAQMSPFRVLRTASSVRMLHSHEEYLEALDHLDVALPVPEEACPVIPPSVLELHVSLWDAKCSCHSKIDHSASTLLISLNREVEADEDHSPLCGLSFDVFKSCVKHLFVQSEHYEDVDEYLQAINGKPRHSKLSVTVLGLDLRGSDKQCSALAREWSTMLGLSVTVTEVEEEDLWPDNC